MPDKPADRARRPPAADNGGETDLRQRIVRRSKRLSTNSLQTSSFFLSRDRREGPVQLRQSRLSVARLAPKSRASSWAEVARLKRRHPGARLPARAGALRRSPKKRRAWLAFLSSLSSGLFFAGLEIFFAHAAQGAYPILGYILKSRSRLNARFGVALLGVIHPLAYGTYVFFHVVCFFFGEYFRLLLSNRAQV